jgi:DNA-directed RNA polymerase subunit K/omega
MSYFLDNDEESEDELSVSSNGSDDNEGLIDDDDEQNLINDESSDDENLSDDNSVSNKLFDTDIDLSTTYDNSRPDKLNNFNKHDYIQENYPELVMVNNNEISNLCKVVRDHDNIIVDNLHKTVPFLTKYEKTKIIGLRTKQINSGSMPFIKVSDSIIDGSIIALMELEQKKIPYIIKRPLPNGGCEYWNLSDLELIL